ncbi:MAG: hypothetical protein GF363_10580 [Chitinivibrionales bacterium]|nr:hypothetical protein [Chitinivibrionales bacterium]
MCFIAGGIHVSAYPQTLFRRRGATEGGRGVAPLGLITDDTPRGKHLVSIPPRAVAANEACFGTGPWNTLGIRRITHYE